ncbi:conserved hypothetical protein [Listeria innocua FSL J1-023]|nr:conserved hypothetical protein [Listeria innocua FSL J1-023]
MQLNRYYISFLRVTYEIELEWKGCFKFLLFIIQKAKKNFYKSGEIPIIKESNAKK